MPDISCILRLGHALQIQNGDAAIQRRDFHCTLHSDIWELCTIARAFEAVCA